MKKHKTQKRTATEQTKTLLQEATETAGHTHIHEKKQDSYKASLLDLWNKDFVDFVKQTKDGEYIAVEWPRHATHELIPTMWNTPQAVKGKGRYDTPDAFALSVCAVPLGRRYKLEGKPIKTSRKLPKFCPLYVAKGPIEGKRKVILWMIQTARAKVSKRAVANATSEQCDNIYRNIKKADALRKK